MRDFIHRYLLLSLFFLSLVSVPVFWLANNAPLNYSDLEARSLATFPALNFKDFRTSIKRMVYGNFIEARSIFFDQFLEKTFQRNVERAIPDQFPLRVVAVQASKWLDRQKISLAYLPLKDQAIPTDIDSEIYVLRDRSRLFPGPKIFDDNYRKLLNAQIDSYDRIIELHEGVNLYAYYIERIEYAPYNPLNGFFQNSDQGKSLAYFEANKPAGMTLGKLQFNSLEDYHQLNYASDHHWNIRSALLAYNDIHAMLDTHYKDISPAITPIKFVTIPGVEYLGSRARQTLYPLEPEKFEVAIIDIPPFTTFVGGKQVNYSAVDKYLTGDFSDRRFANHYRLCFGANKPLIEYVFDNGSQRNLLVIGSSYKNPIQPLLASHYHHSYFVDLRHYANFTLSEFLVEHPVDDILMLGDGQVIFGENEWHLIP